LALDATGKQFQAAAVELAENAGQKFTGGGRKDLGGFGVIGPRISRPAMVVELMIAGAKSVEELSELRVV